MLAQTLGLVDSTEDSTLVSDRRFAVDPVGAEVTILRDQFHWKPIPEPGSRIDWTVSFHGSKFGPP